MKFRRCALQTSSGLEWHSLLAAERPLVVQNDGDQFVGSFVANLMTLSMAQHQPGYFSRYRYDLRVRGPGFGFRHGQEIFFLYSAAFRPALGPTQPPIQWVPEALSLEVKRLKREADHSPTSSADVKNDGAIPPLPICLHGRVLN
jgi:hypothetical protein